MTTQTRKADVPLEVVDDTTSEPRTAPLGHGGSFDEEWPALRSYVETIVDARWIILATMLVALACGGLYYALALPTYVADVLVQVEEKKNTLSGLDDLASMFGSQSPADTEIEILRSRMLVGAVVDELHLDLAVEPRFFPLLGQAIARTHESDQPARSVLGLSSFAWGGEQVRVEQLDVPGRWEGKRLTLVAGGKGKYELLDPGAALLGVGEAGKTFTARGVRLFISGLVARQGTRFLLARLPRAKVMEGLQKRLVISEKGKKTGVIRVALEGGDPAGVSAILDAIARTYLRQNVARRSAEAEKTLQFISGQLPQLKANVEKAEAALNAYRKERGGGFDLSVETKAALDRAAEIEKGLTEIELQRSEMEQRFTKSHPALQVMSRKAAQLRAERQELDSQLKGLPETELNAARLSRDLKIASELYVLLMNRAQELQVMKSGTIGNVRIIDPPLVPQEPVSPKRGSTFGLSLLVGATLGVAIAFARKAIDQGVEDPEIIEREIGLPVYATIPHSQAQAAVSRKGKSQRKTIPVLAIANPDDLAIEALRSLRTSLQFALGEARNNIIAIAGPSPGIGKSFLAVNLAHVLADLDKRVLLVDADLRKGHLHRYFGVEKVPGLADLIRGTAEEKDVVRNASVGNVNFIPMGERPPNPSELLSSSRFHELMAHASREYDLVIVDTPPILAVTDAALAGRGAGTNLMVVRAAQHPIREIAVAVKRLAQNGVDTRAIIVNDVMPRAGGYRYASYGYDYPYVYR